MNFIYFAAVLSLTMLFMHPLALAVNLASGFAYSVMLGGKRALKFNLLYMLPLMIFTAAINPLFNHEGITVLAYFPSGNPLTLESIVYGISASVMLISIVCHFSCFNRIITSDKLMHIFGKAVPSLSLIFTMVLRFVPRFKKQIQAVSNAQKGIGRDVSQGGIITRAKNGITILSVMLTQSLENSIDTADSMKSRGFGSGKRTAYSNFRFSKRDMLALFYITALFAYIIIGRKSLHFAYFPAVSAINLSPYRISVFAAYFMLYTYPIFTEILEAIKWKKLKSKI